MMRSFGVRCLLFCLALGLLLSAQSCTFVASDSGHGGPPAHAPAHGYRARHSYLYYPSSHVYFDTTRRVYFCLTDGYWKMSVSLPSSITINVGEAVSIVLDTDRPYQHFNTHKKRYPPGQLKKKRTPPGHMKKRQPPRVHRAKQKQPPRVYRAKQKQPPRVYRAKQKQPSGKEKETGKGKGKGKDKKE